MLKLPRLSLSVLLPALFFIIAWSIPARGVFEISTDEGINLIKGLLVSEGHPLYVEVWSDQPPLFTFILTAAFKLIGTRVETLRLVITTLSALLLFAAYQFLQAVSGRKQAVLGVILIALLPTYLILSVSIMVGLPSIAFAMFSMAMLPFWHKTKQLPYLVFSAIFLSLAISIKLITGFLAPIFIAGLLIAEAAGPARQAGRLQRLLPAGIWLTVFSATTILTVWLFVGPENIRQLIANHVGATNSEFFASAGEFRLSAHIASSYPYLYLGLIAGVDAAVRKRWALMYPFAWMITAYGLLWFYSPVWYHHVLLITVPGAILGAEAVLVAWQTLQGLIKTVAAGWRMSDGIHLAAFVCAGLFLLSWRPPDALKYLSPSGDGSSGGSAMAPETARLLTCIAAYKKDTHWLLTDRPMFAFRSGLLVPPEFAVLSLKRLKTGEVTEIDLIAGVERYRPEQVLISRFAFPALEQSLAAEYILLVDVEGGEQLYIHETLADDPVASDCRP